MTGYGSGEACRDSVAARGEASPVLGFEPSGSPESFVGGPLALVREGDVIELDIPGRRLDLNVSDDELARRRAAWRKPAPRYARGYGRLFSEHVSQANEGCDFDFLERGAPTPDPEIH